MYRSVIICLCLTISSSSFSQTAAWWENNVQWDGVTHWSRYIMIDPKYMGPNALTVPHINNGSIDSLVSLGLSGHFHFMKGDNTQNLIIYGNYASKDKTFSIDVAYIPVEYFQMSHAVKTERKAYYVYYDKKKASGDFLASTIVQPFQRLKDKFQLAFRLGVRMPAGTLTSLARYGDVPAYWLDIGFAVPFKNRNWKWIGMGGFFVWQLHMDQYRQNDAILFGTGFEHNKNNFRFQSYIGGYSGYRNSGDRPTLVRVNIEKRKKNKLILLRFQQGLHDFKYFSVETGLKYIFGK